MNPVAAEPRKCAAAPAGAPSCPVVDTANSLLRGPGSDGHHNRVTRSGEVSELIQFGNIVPTGLETSGNTIYMARGTSRGWSGWVGLPRVRNGQALTGEDDDRGTDGLLEITGVIRTKNNEHNEPAYHIHYNDYGSPLPRNCPWSQ